jgi:RIO kinase 1
MRDGVPYLIDFGQGVLLSHPKAEEFFERDVRNICFFFRKKGVKCDPEEIIKKIRGKKRAADAEVSKKEN